MERYCRIHTGYDDRKAIDGDGSLNIAVAIDVFELLVVLLAFSLWLRLLSHLLSDNKLRGVDSGFAGRCSFACITDGAYECFGLVPAPDTIGRRIEIS